MAVKGSAQVTVVDITDAYSVMLTSESFTFQGGITGVDAGNTCETEIVAYLGDTPKKVSIKESDIKCPTGISASVSNNNTVSPTVMFTTVDVVSNACEATIPVTVDGITINKKFSFAIAFTGNTGADGKQLYATSSTEAGTATKVATISSFTSLLLYTGITVSVYFSEENTIDNPTLNVNNTGDKPIYAFGAPLTTVYYWKAKSTVQFVYNGTAWVMSADHAMSLAAQWAHDKDTTYINGSKIYASSIGTLQLAANSITAEKIATKAITAEKIDVDDLFSKNITATNMTIEGDSVFKGKLDGASGTFSGNIKAKTVEIGTTELAQVGDLGMAAATFTLDGERAIIKEYANLEDGSAGSSYYDVVSMGTIGCLLESGDNNHAMCELRGESYSQSEASGQILIDTSYLHVDPTLIKLYSDQDIDLSANKISFNGTNWATFKSQHPYDWSTFGTEDNTNTWMPVVNGGRIYHRAVAATLKQANYWDSGTNRITCIRLSNDIVLYLVKNTSATVVNITTAAAKGYRSREYIWGIPTTISTILYANAVVENTLTWDNVELKLHSISSTQMKSHFWSQNSYSGLPLLWYLVLVAKI